MRAIRAISVPFPVLVLAVGLVLAERASGGPPANAPSLAATVAEQGEQIAALQAQVNSLTALLAGASRGVDPNTGQTSRS
jgi:hypothetical protein